MNICYTNPCSEMPIASVKQMNEKYEKAKMEEVTKKWNAFLSYQKPNNFEESAQRAWRGKGEKSQSNRDGHLAKLLRMKTE